MQNRTEPLSLHIEVERLPLITPVRISGYIFEYVEVVVVELGKDGVFGKGEAAGVYYTDDRPIRIAGQLEAKRSEIESGLSRVWLQRHFPPGGARNALDCALWDLEAKLTMTPVWRLANLPEPKPLVTTFTCPVDEPGRMAAAARAFRDAKAIKIKLSGEPIDAERVQAVREARGDVWLSVDANQGYDRDSLQRIMGVLVKSTVSLIEQPFPIGCEAMLDGIQSPIPIAADESAQCLKDLPGLVGRFDMVNIKLDKCGGLTEGLAMARAALTLGLDTMVGNMFGTSWAMAPAFLLGQLCSVVDLDGPVFHVNDRTPSVEYAEGLIDCRGAFWGLTA